jgi:hypothetical protein
MTDGQEGGIDRYTQLLLESITKLSDQTEELNHRYAALDKTICLLKQAYEASLQADRQVMGDLLVQFRRITVIVEDLACREHTRRIRDFQGRITALEAYVTPSKWAVRFIAAFFRKTGWIFGALIMGSIGYAIYIVAVILLGKF